MADKKNGGVEKNPMADAANWNARVITEIEAPHKWNEAWGQMFQTEIPHDYKERIKYLEEELRQLPNIKPYPKYGGSEPFPTLGGSDNRRKKMFQEIVYDEEKKEG